MEGSDRIHHGLHDVWLVEHMGGPLVDHVVLAFPSHPWEVRSIQISTDRVQAYRICRMEDLLPDKIPPVLFDALLTCPMVETVTEAEFFCPRNLRGSMANIKAFQINGDLPLVEDIQCDWPKGKRIIIVYITTHRDESPDRSLHPLVDRKLPGDLKAADRTQPQTNQKVFGIDFGLVDIPEAANGEQIDTKLLLTGLGKVFDLFNRDESPIRGLFFISMDKDEGTHDLKK